MDKDFLAYAALGDVYAPTRGDASDGGREDAPVQPQGSTTIGAEREE